MAKYFNAVHNFKSEFDIVFAPRDGLQANVNDNILWAAEVSHQLRTFSIPNPFILDDEQHLDFHRHLEQQNNKFQNGFSMLQASGSMWKFVFFIPPGHVLHEDICQEFHKAMQRARLPKSQLYILCAISFFDEIGDWSGEGYSMS
ncbi:hypothetical protein C8R43DRAFT_949922 [Mycena crocata]|nr:hypothetical protein C8R43DRAFT_949922 [Mycena crocata]